MLNANLIGIGGFASYTTKFTKTVWSDFAEVTRFAKLVHQQPTRPHFYNTHCNQFSFAICDGPLLKAVGYGDTAREAYREAHRAYRLRQQNRD